MGPMCQFICQSWGRIHQAAHCYREIGQDVGGCSWGWCAGEERDK